jgi:hypothetical protein
MGERGPATVKPWLRIGLVVFGQLDPREELQHRVAPAPRKAAAASIIARQDPFPMQARNRDLAHLVGVPVPVPNRQATGGPLAYHNKVFVAGLRRHIAPHPFSSERRADQSVPFHEA